MCTSVTAAALKAGFSLKDTFDGNSPFTFEDGSEVVNEGEGTGNNYGSAISLTTATEQSVNTAYSDLTESLPNGPKDILKMAVAMGIPEDDVYLCEDGDVVELTDDGLRRAGEVPAGYLYVDGAGVGSAAGVSSDAEAAWRRPRALREGARFTGVTAWASIASDDTARVATCMLLADDEGCSGATIGASACSTCS